MDNTPTQSFLDAQAIGEGNEPTSLRPHLGKYIALFFYPKDQTPGCTTQACAFRDLNSELLAENITVIGVSADSQESHERFKEKHQFPFPLWTDQSGELRKAFEVGSTFGVPSRCTFLLDPDGQIIKEWKPAKPETNAQEVLEAVAEHKQHGDQK